MNDYTPVIPVARGPLVASVHPSLPARNLRELIALAKARPGQIVYGSAGQGTIVHLANALFLHGAGISMVHVPYKGGAPAMTDLIAGQISLVFATPQVGLAQAKAGRIRALAVTTRERIAAEPNIPTIAESGVPGFEVIAWYNVFAPARTPRPIVTKLNTEINRLLQTADVRERFQTLGVAPLGGPPEALAKYLDFEITRWSKLIKTIGVQLK